MAVTTLRMAYGWTNRNNMDHRNLKLSHQEIELLNIALNYIYNRKMQIVGHHTPLLSEEERKAILKNANLFDNLRIAIAGGERDV